MILGIVLHASQIYRPNSTWVIHSENSIFFTDILIKIIHEFRMPTFFIISGYFCLLTLRKYPINIFISKRLLRLVIPLLSTAVLLNSVQALVLHSKGWLNLGIKEYFLTGQWLSHLWFLNILILYFSFTAFLYFLSSTYLKELSKKINSKIASIDIYTLIFIFPFFSLALMLGYKLINTFHIDTFGIVDLYEVFFYAPFFIFGLILTTSSHLLKQLNNIKFWVLFGLYFILTYVKSVYLTVDAISLFYLDSIRTLCLVFICFKLFSTWFNKPSKLSTFLSDSAYTVYLFHHIVVIFIGLILIELFDQYNYFNLFFIISVTLIITFLIHNFIIKPNTLLRFLFNGK